MLRFEMKTLLMNRTSFDGTGISIHHLSFSPLDQCVHLVPPSQPILCLVRSFSTNTLRHCPHLHTLNLRPWQCHPSSFFCFRSHSMLCQSEHPNRFPLRSCSSIPTDPVPRSFIQHQHTAPLPPSPHPEPSSMAMSSELFLLFPQPFHVVPE